MYLIFCAISKIKMKLTPGQQRRAALFNDRLLARRFAREEAAKNFAISRKLRQRRQRNGLAIGAGVKDTILGIFNSKGVSNFTKNSGVKYEKK